MTGKKKEIVTVKNIRNVNIENIMQTLLHGQDITRSLLAKENDVSLMTVKHIVDDLIGAKVLVEKVSVSSDVGRNPKVLEIAEKYGNIVCVNLTSKAEMGFLIYDIYENLLKEYSVTLGGALSYRGALDEMIETIKENLSELGRETVAAAVFVPSAYDEAMDLVNYDLIPDFKELRIKALFREALGLENVLVLHDVFAAARSEYDSLNPKMESQFYFYCGYGVGGFFIHKDVEVTGAQNVAGEVGKMLVSMKGGEKDYTIFEDIVSVSAVKKRMKDHGIDVSFNQMLDLYQAGNEDIREFLKPVLDTVCRVLYNLLWVYNPTRIVIDSCKDAYSQIITEYFQKFIEEMEDDAIPMHVQVRKAKYDEYHMMRGCFYMARNAWIQEIARAAALSN